MGAAFHEPTAACSANPCAERATAAGDDSRADGARAGGDSGRQKEPQAPKGTIKVNVNLVNVLVSVLDENKRPAPNLPQEAFQVSEEGVPQKIEFFEPETKLPLDLALMIDASMSAHIDFQYEREAASRFIRQVLRPDDRMSVFSFDETVTQRTTFTERVQTLTDAVARIPDGAGTSIYDAVTLGSQALEKRGGERRRVIILVTDGGETTSHADFESGAAGGAARRSAAVHDFGPHDEKREWAKYGG